MKTMTADQARAHALRSGAELVIGGRHFNSDRAQVVKPISAAPAPRAAAPTLPVAPSTPAAAAPPPPETFSKADVEQMLAKQEERFTERLTNLLSSLQRPESDDKSEFYATGFKPEMDKDGCITFVKVQYERLQ